MKDKEQQQLGCGWGRRAWLFFASHLASQPQSGNAAIIQQQQGLLQALPGLRGRKLWCCLLQQPEAAAGPLQPSLQVRMGRGKGKESAGLTGTVVLGSRAWCHEQKMERQGKMVWGCEMAGTPVCGTSDCAAGLWQQSLCNMYSEEKTAGKWRGENMASVLPPLHAML